VRVAVGLGRGPALRASAGLLVRPRGTAVVGLHAVAAAGLPVPGPPSDLVEAVARAPQRSGSWWPGSWRRSSPLPSALMALYAAYASNLHPDRMATRAPHSPLEATGWLRGWRLTFGGEERGWDGALATVVEVPEQADPAHPEVPPAQVFVAVYDLTDADAEELDRWEGADLGLYTKVKVRVDTLEGELLAWTYVLDDYEGGMPSAFYLGMLADAAEAAGAPDDYVAELRARPCRSVG